MNLLSSRAYSLRRTVAMIAAGPLTFVLAVLLAAAALAVPFSVASLAIALGPAVSALQPVAEVSVFVTPGTPTREVEAMRQRLAARPGTVEVRWVRRDDALADLTRRFGHAVVPKEGAENPLPDLLIARLEPRTSPERLDAAAAEFEKWPHVNAVRTDVEGYRRLNSLLRLAMVVGAVFGALLGALTLVVVLGAVRLQTQAHSDEVAVLKMAGASTAFVARPYAYGAALILGLAAGVAVIAAHAIGAVLSPAIHNASAAFGSPLQLELPDWRWGVAAVLTATAVGALAGALSVRYSTRDMAP